MTALTTSFVSSSGTGAPAGTPTGWLGRAYEGEGIQLRMAELLALRHIKPALLAKESALFKVKWFDNRHLHPTEATYLFAHKYVKAVKRATRIHRCVKEAMTVRGIKHRDIFKLDAPQITGLWKARQAADLMGVPYGVFCNTAVEGAFHWGWSTCPTPAQLYGTDYLMERVIQVWHESCRAGLKFAQGERFAAGAYNAHPDQDAHCAWLISQINARPALTQSLSFVVFQKPVLPEAIAVREYGEEAVSRALEFSSLFLRDIFSQ